MLIGVKTGPFEDRRPAFAVYVTGHPGAIAAGPWAYSPLGRRALAHPGAPELRNYLDAVLWRRRDAHRVHVYCRGGRGLACGVDETVRAYCALRDIPCLPLGCEGDTWGPEAEYRRDLHALALSHALVWFGRRHPRDPVTLAALLGVPYRVVALPVAEPYEEGVR